MKTLPQYRFQIDVPQETRTAVKVEAVRAGLSPSEMSSVLLAYAVGLLATGRPPKALSDAVEAARAEKVRRAVEAG